MLRPAHPPPHPDAFAPDEAEFAAEGANQDASDPERASRRPRIGVRKGAPDPGRAVHGPLHRVGERQGLAGLRPFLPEPSEPETQDERERRVAVE
jgi:hypothetical protein